MPQVISQDKKSSSTIAIPNTLSTFTISNFQFLLGISLLAMTWVIFSLSATKPALPSITQTINYSPSLPDFSVYKDVKLKKLNFFRYLYPIVDTENQHILRLRNSLLALKAKGATQLTNEQTTWLHKLAQHYKVNDENINTLINALLLRVDIIPVSLVLAQAAIESGWGSSRFALEGNNLFGQWCFKKGCGIVPQSRQEDKQHEVADFKSINASVRAYLRNLNTFPAYQELRKLRSIDRGKSGHINANSLVQGLEHYSEQGEVYTDKVFKLMRQNKLSTFVANQSQPSL